MPTLEDGPTHDFVGDWELEMILWALLLFHILFVLLFIFQVGYVTYGLWVILVGCQPKYY